MTCSPCSKSFTCKSHRPSCPFIWQTAVQHRHKLKHHFYSPNIQSKSIIDSQTSTIKIQPFFFLDTEGHCLKIVVYPVDFTCFLITVMLMDHYLYKHLKWPSRLRTFFRPGSWNICRLACIIWSIEQFNQSQRSIFIWLRKVFCDSFNFLWLKVVNQTPLIPAGSCRIKQTWRIICK